MKSYYLSVTTQYDDEELFFTDELEALDEFHEVVRHGYDNGNGKSQPVIEAQIKMTETSGGMIVTEEVIAAYRKYTTYAPDTDITFILVDRKRYNENSTEVVGFYYGGENAELTDYYAGKRKAIFRDSK